MNTSDHIKTVLVVTSHYPPGRQVGAERVLKFRKHLPQHGFHCKILTLSDFGCLRGQNEGGVHRSASIAGYFYNLAFQNRLKNLSETNCFQEKIPSHDDSRIWQRVRRAIIGNLFVPDILITWLPTAFIAGMRAIHSADVRLIMATSPSPSSLLIGAMLSWASGLPLVLDFRDGWIFENPDPAYLPGLSHWRRKMETLLEKWVVSQAAAVVSVSPPLTEYFRKSYRLRAGRAVTIPNGYDPDDWNDVQVPPKSPNKLRIVYTGRIISSHRAGCFDMFLQGLALSDPDVIENIEVLFIGIQAAEARRITGYGLNSTVKIIPYLPKRQCIGYQLSSDVLLLFMGKDKSVMTSKIFEYLFSNRLIWVLGDEECAGSRFVKTIRAGIVTNPQTPSDISTTVKKLTRLWDENRLPSGAGHGAIQPYSRQHASKQLASLFKSVLRDDRLMERPLVTDVLSSGANGNKRYSGNQ